MKRLRLIILFHFLGLSCFAQPMNGTFIVGGPQGDFATLSLAVQQLQQRGMSGPVTLKIYAGTYWEQIYIHNIPGSSYQNKLTIKSESGNNDVIITFNLQDYNYAYLICLGDIHHVEIKNLSFLADGLYATCIKATNGNHEVLKVYNCKFTSVNCPGSLQGNSYILSTKDLDSVLISNSTFIGCAAISTLSTSYTEISNNLFYQNRYYILYRAGVSCIFSNNIVFSDHTGYSVVESLSSSTSGSFLAENNKIVLKGKWGPVFWVDYQTSLFFNNTINADSSIGIKSTNGLSLYHNTIKVQKLAVYNIQYIDNLKNNILITTEGSLFRVISNLPSINSNYNVFHSPANYPFCTFSDTNVSAIPDFATWQNTGIDTHSIWGIPLFSKPYDLHLQAGDTLARSAGTPIVSVTHDIDGDLRNPLNPDIGADEVVIRPVLDDFYNACTGSPYTLDAGAGFSSYQWSTGAITQTITLQPSTDTATYTCTVTFGSSSGQKTTEVRWVNCTAIMKHDKTRLAIRSYPNPASRSITLQASEGNNLPKGILQFYSIQGVKQFEVPLPPNLQKLEVDISSLPAGLFLSRIIGHTGETGVFRFVKSH